MFECSPIARKMFQSRVIKTLLEVFKLFFNSSYAEDACKLQQIYEIRQIRERKEEWKKSYSLFLPQMLVFPGKKRKQKKNIFGLLFRVFFFNFRFLCCFLVLLVIYKVFFLSSGHFRQETRRKR